jgi:hypothetical protein
MVRRANKPTLIQIMLRRRIAQVRFRAPGLISAVGERSSLLRFGQTRVAMVPRHDE